MEEKLTIDLIRPREEVFKHLDWLTAEVGIMSTAGEVLGNFLLSQVEGFFFNVDGVPKGMAFAYADKTQNAVVVTFLTARNHARLFREMFYAKFKELGFDYVRSMTNYHNPKVVARLFNMKIIATVLEKRLS